MNKFYLTMFSLFPTLAFASERTDNSMVLVYGFLFMCGMIIFLQCIPLFILIYGMIKGMTRKVIFKESSVKK